MLAPSSNPGAGESEEGGVFKASKTPLQISGMDKMGEGKICKKYLSNFFLLCFMSQHRVLLCKPGWP